MVERACRMRRWAAVALAALTLLLGACSGPHPTASSNTTAPSGHQSPATTATVTGTAWPCAGIVTAAVAARFSIHVVLTRNARVVAAQVVRGGTMYHFTVTPGTYVVSSNAQYMEPVQVTVRTGDIEHVDLTPPCK